MKHATSAALFSLLYAVVACSSSPDTSTGKDAAPADAAGQSIDGEKTDTRAASLFGLTTRPANEKCRPPAAPSQMAPLLSATGCFDPTDPRKPGPALIPYDVASPLWSDGAEKKRYFALPDGQKVHVKDCLAHPEECKPKTEGGTPQDEGHLDFPVGTILVKTFGFASKLHETRLLIRFREDLWKGYSYRWTDDQKDAELEPDEIAARTGKVNNAQGVALTWSYPSRTECLQCHTDAAGVSLGGEVGQLNFDFKYPSGVTSNQLDTLANVGIFDGPLPAKRSEPLPNPYGDSGTVESRARSYLHANCAICHRPYSNFAEFDVRFGSVFKDARVCNVDPSKGNLGVAGAKRVVPGKPEQSLMTLRMHALDVARMPQIGTSVVDEPGTKLIEDWIRGLSACP